MKRRLAIALGVLLVLTGCSNGDDGSEVSRERAGAKAAAQAYADAIAARDVETADAMTAPQAFERFAVGDVDVRGALPRARAPIEDPWVTITGRRDGLVGYSVEYGAAMSYEIDNLAGGGMITLGLKSNANPDEIKNWVVTRPLLITARTYSKLQRGSFGGIALFFGSSGQREVGGYPGSYLLEPRPGVKDVDPLVVTIGAEQPAPWQMNRTPPRLGGKRVDPQSSS